MTMNKRPRWNIPSQKKGQDGLFIKSCPTHLIFISLFLLVLIGLNSASSRDNDLKPVCIGNSICGFIQRNVKGEYPVQMCSCSDHQECPMHWNEQRDFIEMSSEVQEQYQYCGSVSPIHPDCSTESDSIAYLRYEYYRQVSGQLVASKDKMLCRCSSGQILIHNRQERIGQTEDFSVFRTTYHCIETPSCQTGAIIREVTRIANTTFLVREKCKCPMGNRCFVSHIKVTGSSQVKETHS